MKRRNLSISLVLIILCNAVLAACGAPSASAPNPPASATSAAVAPSTAEGSATSAAVAPSATESPATPNSQPAPASAGGTPTRGGRLVVVDSGDASVLDPFHASWHGIAIYSVFDTLIHYTPDLSNFVPGLAEKWEVAPDKLSLTLTLRKDVKFQDGTPMDAKAVKWNFDKYRDKATASPLGSSMTDLVTDVQTPDDYTVVLKLAKPFAPLLDLMASLEIASPTAYQQEGPDKFAQNPVGAGRWNIKENVPNDHILYTRNPDYAWGAPDLDNKGASYPDELEIKLLTDEATTYATLETGESQIASIPAQFLKKARENSNIEVVQGVNPGLDVLNLNFQHKPLDNKNIRQALSRAINRDEVIAAGYEGEAEPIYGPLSPSEVGYSEAVEAKARGQGYDPQKAKDLLAAEGWKDSDGDGVLENGSDKLELHLLVLGDPHYKRMGETIQAELGDIGVKVDLDVKDGAALKDELDKGSFDIFLYYFALVDPWVLCYMYCSDGGGNQRLHYSNPELEKLLKAANAELDPAERKKKVADAMMLLIEDQPKISLLAAHTFMGYRKDKVAGLKFDATGGPILDDAYLIQK